MTEHFDVDAGGDLRLHAVSSGEGPAIVLLHGFTGSSSTWDFLRPALESRHTVIAVDLPGHGRSSSPADPARYALGRFPADLAAVLDALQIQRAAVGGYSMGGRAALQFALDQPGRAAALILESTSSGIAPAEERQARGASDALLADLIERDGVEAFVSRWEMLPLWETQRSIPDAGRRTLRDQRLANSAVGLANSLRGAGAGARDDVLEAAGGIAAPALIIAGGLDNKYADLGRQLANAIPNSTLEIVAGAGHAVHLEQPRAFVDCVAAFLATFQPA